MELGNCDGGNRRWSMRVGICCLIIASCLHPFGFTINGQVNTQQDSDSAGYFSDYSELLALRIYTNVKASHLDIIKDGQALLLRPNSPASLGVGFNYKGYGLGIAVGLPVSASSRNRYGKTKRFDIQANVNKNNLGIDGFAQFYKGYYNSNPQDFIEWEGDAFPKLPDMRIMSIGLNAFYIFNDEKFSFKAAFVRNQVQHKSAGSFTAGVFGHYDESTTEQGFKPVEFPDSIGTSFDLKSFNALAIGITVGYLYTWVISDHFFLNIGVTPGFGNQRIELTTLDGQKSSRNSAAAQFTARSAFGYESRILYAGITGRVIWRNFQYRGYDLDLSTGQFRVLVGKRF